ncbi:replication initiator protein A [Aerococcus viridans]
MTEFNYLTADQGYKTFFLQLPKPFITSPKYKTLSSDAKIAYTLLRDRAEYSLMNNLVDEKNRIYFLFTDEDLANDLSVSRNTARKVKQELIQVNLLKKVDMGYNKREHKRNASRHYLAELEVNASDVYPIQKNNEQNLKNAQNVDMAHGANFEHRVNHKESAQNVDMAHGANFEHSDMAHGANFEQELDRTIYKDIKDIKDQTDFQNQQIANQFSKNEKATEQELIEQYVEENELVSAYGQQTIQLVKNYSFNDLTQFKVYSDKFYYGWKSIEKEMDIKINPYEKAALHDELASTFKRVIIQFKQGKTKNVNDYLYISLKNVFKDYAESQQTDEMDLPPVPLKWPR